MTQEEKELLLRDLCARLTYHPKGVKLNTPFDPKDITIVGYIGRFVETVDDEIEVERVRLYLRPMSSMTEEECITLSKLIPYETDAWKYIKTPIPLYIANIEQFDFFHRHHLDWRGLIPKGLAFEAPEGMYN